MSEATLFVIVILSVLGVYVAWRVARPPTPRVKPLPRRWRPKPEPFQPLEDFLKGKGNKP